MAELLDQDGWGVDPSDKTVAHYYEIVEGSTNKLITQAWSICGASISNGHWPAAAGSVGPVAKCPKCEAMLQQLQDVAAELAEQCVDLAKEKPGSKDLPGSSRDQLIEMGR